MRFQPDWSGTEIVVLALDWSAPGPTPSVRLLDVGVGVVIDVGVTDVLGEALTPGVTSGVGVSVLVIGGDGVTVATAARAAVGVGVLVAFGVEVTACGLA